MRARRVSRVVGFVFVVAAMGGIGAAAWAGETEPAPQAPSAVVGPAAEPSPSAPAQPAPTSRVRLFDSSWG